MTLPMLTLNASASLRTNLSFQHIGGAAIFARECQTIEARHTPVTGDWPYAPDADMLRHAAHATAAVISAACALEATVNEFYLDACDRNERALGRAEGVAPLIERLWDTVERASVLRKYQWVLSLARAELFPPDEAPFSQAASLMVLRHALVHYKPEWSNAATINSRLEARLGTIFPYNPLAAPGQFFIPYRCLGFGCAAWAIRAARDFIVSFHERLGIRSLMLSYDAELHVGGE